MSYKYKCVCKHTSSGMKPRKMMEQTTENGRAPTTPQELEDTSFFYCRRIAPAGAFTYLPQGLRADRTYNGDTLIQRRA